MMDIKTQEQKGKTTFDPTRIPNSLKKKMALKNQKYSPKIPFKLDPALYHWKWNCKKCHGRGYIGFEEKSKKYILCRCAGHIKEPVKPVKK